MKTLIVSILLVLVTAFTAGAETCYTDAQQSVLSVKLKNAKQCSGDLEKSDRSLFWRSKRLDGAKDEIKELKQEVKDVQKSKDELNKNWMKSVLIGILALIFI